jgi:hypothetical protein
MCMQEVLEKLGGSNGVLAMGFQGVLDFSDVQYIFRECWILPANATRFSGGALCTFYCAPLQHLACSGISERTELQQSARNDVPRNEKDKASGLQQSLGMCLAL